MFSLAAESLKEADSGTDRLLSVQVYLADIHFKDQFDVMWNEWIGNNNENWPQRICVEAKLAPGLLLEIQMTAASNQASFPP